MIPSFKDTFLDFFTIVLWGVILVSMLPITRFWPCFTGRVFLNMLSSGFVNVLSVNAAKLTILLILGFCNRCLYRIVLDRSLVWISLKVCHYPKDILPFLWWLTVWPSMVISLPWFTLSLLSLWLKYIFIIFTSCMAYLSRLYLIAIEFSWVTFGRNYFDVWGPN